MPIPSILITLLAGVLLIPGCTSPAHAVAVAEPQAQSAPAASAATPKTGEKAPAFSLKTLDETAISLTPLLKKGPVVLVVLRGYPGYQCPFCTRQVGDLMAQESEFAKRNAEVVLVYPGPTEGLDRYAGEFISGKTVPKAFHFTTDPGYALVNAYGLRWNAKNETAHPSTFVIGKDGVVTYAKVAEGHGDRAPLADVLAALDALPKG